MLTMLKSKLHMATVTQAERNYEGSLTIDTDLMETVKILPYEKIMVSNLANIHRFETYAIPGKAGSRTICLNGPTANLGGKGDRLIIFSFCLIPSDEALNHRPLILGLDENNKPVGPLKEV